MPSAREAYIALNMVPDIGPRTIKNLVSFFGSPEKVLSVDEGDLVRCPGIGAKKAAALALAGRKPGYPKEEERSSRLGVRIVTIVDDEYPKLLLETDDPPPVIYAAGDLSVFGRPSVAIVGSRTPSVYGRETAERISYAVASAGYAVVSGIALGIDAAAHRGALFANGCTIAVLGGAIDEFYPDENRDLGRKIIASGGLVISEFPFGKKPNRHTFPARNRIVSGLSMATLVVEASQRSGSMITAAMALEQGRCVMAVPGRIDSQLSYGPNRLIQDGAKLVMCADDILDELAGAVSVSKTAKPAEKARDARMPLSEEESRLVDAIEDAETSVDELIESTGIDSGRAGALLVTLQIKKYVKLLPGGWVLKL